MVFGIKILSVSRESRYYNLNFKLSELMFPASIFKAYDIRGLVASELSPKLAYAVGRSFAQLLKERDFDIAKRPVVVGRDMRPSSPLFEQAVIEGIGDEGGLVVKIGQVSTPLFNFAVTNFPEYASGIMITASHNPAAYNGFKMTFADGLPLGKTTGMNELREKAARLYETTRPVNPNRPPVIERNVLPDYCQKIFTLVSPAQLAPLRLVIDAGNGMAAATFPEIIKHLPVQAEFLFLEPDGTFPNHEANPLKTETLRALQQRIRETGADFGFALDGDCDRIGLVDEHGEIVDASFVGALVGLEVLRDHKNQGRMFYDIRSSKIVPELWQAHGATVAPCPVGHALIKKLLKEQGGIFASELSLHQYFHSMHDVESSDLSLLYILRALSREKKPLSQLIFPFKKYFHSGEINFEVHDAEQIIQKIEAVLAPQAAKISHLDGLYMDFPWGWLSLRSSNTEPVLRLNLETLTSSSLEQKKTEIIDLIQADKH